MRGRGRWIWLALALLLSALACEPDPAPNRVYLEDFESACDGAPCGWERSAGEADQALWVETIHPGEHGLRLEGEVTVRGPGAPADAARAFPGGLRASLVGVCDPGSFARITILLEDAFGAAAPPVDIDSGLPPEWGLSETDVMIEGDSDYRVTGIVIGKSGAGVCEIGELLIDTNTFPGGC